MRKGTHGTCRTRAQNIFNVGFSGLAAGKRGSGVYFWGYNHDELEPQVCELASAWWNYSLKQGRYSKEANPKCAVINVSLHLSDEEVLDMEGQIIREKFIIYSQKVLAKLQDVSDELVSQVYDMFVASLESVLGQSFKMVHVKVQRPTKWKYALQPQNDISGQPSCYVVKELTCISIDGVKELDYE